MRRLIITAGLLGLFTLHAAAQEPEAPEPDAMEPTHTAVVPVVANTIGVANVNWRSEVLLQNNSNTDAQALLAMPGLGGEPFLFTTVPAGQRIVLADLIGETFGTAWGLAPLIVQTFGTQPLAVFSVVRAITPEGEAAPQSVPAIFPPFIAPRQMLRGLVVNDTFRTNIGLANLGESPIQFSLGLQMVSGRFVETTTLSVAPYSTTQLRLQDAFPVLARGTDLIVVVEPSGPNGFAYASVIENATSNGRFVLPGLAPPPPG